MRTDPWIGIVIFGFSMLMSSCHKKVDFKNSDQRMSYAVGVQLAKNMEKENVELDPDAVALAIKHVKEGSTLKLSESEMQAIFKDKNDFSMKKKEMSARDNLVKAKEFMLISSQIPKIKKTPSGLLYLVLEEGKGQSITSKKKVKMNYLGSLMNGTKFDSTYDRGEPTVINIGSLVKGLAEGLAYARIGGKYKFFIPPNLAYGPNGSAGAGVPPNMALVYEVDVLDSF